MPWFQKIISPSGQSGIGSSFSVKTTQKYYCSETDCKDCPLRAECCGKITKFKKIEDSIHKPLYDKMHAKLNRNKNYTRMLTKRRSSTVEPVLDTLINHHNMKHINSRGMPQANKHVMMAALSYNLKKFLRFVVKKPVPITIGIAQAISLNQGKFLAFLKVFLHELKNSFLSLPNFRICRLTSKTNLA